MTAQRITGKSKASVRALTYCDLHFISKENLIYTMGAYPEFRKTFIVDLQITYDLRDPLVSGERTCLSWTNVAILL